MFIVYLYNRRLNKSFILYLFFYSFNGHINNLVTMFFFIIMRMCLGVDSLKECSL